MRRKSNRLVLTLSGIIVTVLIATSLIIVLFFPELLPFRADAQSEATTEIKLEDTTVQLDSSMMLYLGSVGKGLEILQTIL